MKRTLEFFSVIAIIAISGFCFITCKTDMDDSEYVNNDPKTIIITGLTDVQKAEASVSYSLGVFPPGASSGYVALGIKIGEVGGSSNNWTVTMYLFESDISNGSVRWTGVGTYDFWLILKDDSLSSLYVAENITIDSEVTAISASTFVFRRAT